MIEVHKFVKRLLSLIIFLGICFSSAQAVVINKIAVQGNKRIPSSSVIAYSELSDGLDVSQADISRAIKLIYEKGIFEHVSMEIDDDVLVIHIKERPVIRNINVKKNKLIPEEGLNEMLKKSNLVNGEVLNPMKLKQLVFMLKHEYRLSGYPDVQISESITHVNDGMVDVKITIRRGDQYQVGTIKVNGNLAFSDSVVSEKMSLNTPSLYARIFGGNYYSSQALEKGKADLTNFYSEEGFLRFYIEDIKTESRDNSKIVDITINLHEGPRFMYSHVGVYGDNIVKSTAIPEIQRLEKQIKNQEKMPFSRKNIYQLRKTIMEVLEKEGHTIKTIEPKIKVDQKNATVDVRFYVQRGVPTVVRKIDFSGNTLTMDRVLRREMALSEGEVYSETAVQESIRRISNLGYVKNVTPQVKPVINSPKEVDVILTLEESPQATANLEMGLNQNDFIVFSAGIVHPNFGGTGNGVDLKLEKSRVRSSVSVKGKVPFVLPNGLGLGYRFFYNNQVDNSDTTVSKYTWQQSYGVEKYGLNLSAQIPISIYQDLGITTEINKNNYSYDPSRSDIPENVTQSINRYGNNLWNLVVTTNWVRSTLDRAILPSSGNKEEVSIKLGSPLNEDFTSYITLDSKFSYFQKLGKLPLTINPTGRFGIGQGFKGFTSITGCLLSQSNDPACQTELPFDEKFYSMSTSPVRGILTFGEKVNGKAIGGDLITTASLNMFLKPFNDDQIIPSVFIDGGYVFNEHAFNFNQWVYSTGLQVRVMTPVAPIVLVFSYPLKIDGVDSKYGKDTFRYFQFSMQANLY